MPNAFHTDSSCALQAQAAPVKAQMPGRRHLLLAGAALAAAGLVPATAAAQPLPKAGPGRYTELRWADLVPKGWDPMKDMRDKGIASPAGLMDGDPKTDALMSQLRQAWDNAPTEPTLDGSRVKLPGYLVPLDESPTGLTEFLLVPYFGACIHTPPPPANQIVLVVPAKPVAGLRSMDTVWVSGTIKTVRGNSAMGSTGYRIDATLVEAYKASVR